VGFIVLLLLARASLSLGNFTENDDDICLFFFTGIIMHVVSLPDEETLVRRDDEQRVVHCHVVENGAFGDDELPP
jgi:hypothetical protein